jgi:hypothetical protein
MTQSQSICTEIEPNLDAFADNELKDSERQSVERHLATCPACQLRLSQISRLKQSLAALPQIAPKRDLVDEMPDFFPKARPRNVLVFAPFVWASVAIAASAMLLLLVFRGMPASNRSAVASADKPGQLARQPDKVPDAERPEQIEQAYEGPEMIHSAGQAVAEKRFRKPADELAANSTARTAAHSTQESQAVADKPSSPEAPASGASEEPGPGVEVATLDEVGHSTITGAIGIATDEDGLYDIKM